MKLINKTSIDSALLDALIRRGIKAMRLRRLPHIVIIGKSKYPHGKYIPSTQTIMIWLPDDNEKRWGFSFIGIQSSWLRPRMIWQVLLHELAHFKDIGIKCNDSDWTPYSRHDRRPVELRAMDLVDEAKIKYPWQYASKEIMAIAMNIAEKKHD